MRIFQGTLFIRATDRVEGSRVSESSVLERPRKFIHELYESKVILSVNQFQSQFTTCNLAFQPFKRETIKTARTFERRHYGGIIEKLTNHASENTEEFHLATHKLRRRSIEISTDAPFLLFEHLTHNSSLRVFYISRNLRLQKDTHSIQRSLDTQTVQN